MKRLGLVFVNTENLQTSIAGAEIRTFVVKIKHDFLLNAAV